MTSGLVLGVDGGTSKTLALVADREGTVLGLGRAGGSNIYAGDPDRAIANAKSSTLAAVEAASCSPEAVTAALFSMSGADWPEDLAVYESAARSWGLRGQLEVVNDAFGGLRAGSPANTGVVIVCGTGVATAGRGPDGATWQSSFWQRTGGGDHLARKTLDAVYGAALGLAPATTLTEALLTSLGLPTVETVLHRLTARSAEAPPLSSMVPLLLDAAAGGDAVARQIVADHGRALGDYALVAASKVGLGAAPFDLVLTGGVFDHPSNLLAEAIGGRVQAMLPAAQPTRGRFPPVVGALLLALENSGVTVDAAVQTRIERSLPPLAALRQPG